jgi:hypothetical protein
MLLLAFTQIPDPGALPPAREHAAPGALVPGLDVTIDLTPVGGGVRKL